MALFDFAQTATRIENWTGRTVKLREAEDLVASGYAVRRDRTIKGQTITFFQRTDQQFPSRPSFTSLTAADAELLASVTPGVRMTPWLKERMERIAAYAPTMSSDGSRLQAA